MLASKNIQNIKTSKDDSNKNSVRQNIEQFLKERIIHNRNNC